MNRLLSACLLPALLPASAAYAEERGYTITSFDRIRLEGPFTVTVVSNRGPSARVQGSAAALDDVIVRVDGRTLVMRRGAGGWGGPMSGDRGPVSIAVTVPHLSGVSVAGAGRLAIDAMKGQRVDLVVDGAGRLTVERIETDRLNATMAGAGTIVAGGQAAEARVIVRGAGDFDGARLTAADATVTADGAPTISLAARRSAAVTANGSGSVVILGRPACTVRNTGAGEVACGGGSR